MPRIRDLTMRYPDGKVALIRFSFVVGPCEPVVVLGGNGSGETTLLRCITRMLDPTAGEVWLDDTNLRVSGDRLRQARMPLAMIWQQADLVRRRSVIANVVSGTLGRHGGLWTARWAACRRVRSPLPTAISTSSDWRRLLRSGRAHCPEARPLALPPAILAAENVTPSRYLHYAARGDRLCRPVPDIVWALLFVTAVGLGRFPACWRCPCSRSACSAGCSPKPSSTWTWRRSMRWR